MRWIEIIKVQTCRAPADGKPPGLPGLVAASRAARGLVSTRILDGAGMRNEYGVIFDWDTDRIARYGSDIGREVAAGLRGCGLVDHSVWIVSD